MSVNSTPLARLKRHERSLSRGQELTAYDWLEVATASHELALWSQAVRAYRIALHAEPALDSADHRFNLGVALTFDHAPTEAIIELEIALQRAPCALYFKGLGDALAVLGEPELSHHAYQRCLKLEMERSVSSRRASGACIEALHQSASGLPLELIHTVLPCVERWRVALADSPDLISLSHYTEALLWRRLGDPERALDAHLKGARLKRDATPHDWDEQLRLLRQLRDAHLIYGRSTADERACLTAADARHAAPIFIIGMPRSGTSLAAQILARHADVSALGERGVLYETLRGWSALGATEMMRAPDPQELSEIERVRRSRLSDDALGHADYCLELMRELLHSQRGVAADDMIVSSTQTRYVEKTPSHYLFAGWIHQLFPNAKIVHCRRDPLATCYSCFTHHFTSGHEWSYDLEDVGLYYLSYLEQMRFWSERGIEMHELHLERLTANPEPEIRALLEFCDLSWDPACLSPESSDTLVYTSSMHQVREPIRARPEAWRDIAYRLTPLSELLNLSPEERAQLFEFT